MSDRRPICTHRGPDQIHGRVSSHRDLVAAHNRGEATASTLVCDSDMCRSDAVNWVYEHVGVLGAFHLIGPLEGGNR